jgi:hypothetical protein
MAIGAITANGQLSFVRQADPSSDSTSPGPHGSSATGAGAAAPQALASHAIVERTT